MITFCDWLNEIALAKKMPNIHYSSNSERGSLKKLEPNSNKFNVIPISINPDFYNLLKKYQNNKFKEIDDILDRPDYDNTDTIYISNEDLYNLRQMLNYIVSVANDPLDIEFAKSNLVKIH